MSALSSTLPMEDASPSVPEPPMIPPSQQVSDPEGEGQGWLLTSLKPWHHQLCSMLAQGIPRGTIARVLDCTPEYVTMLARQPLIRKNIQDISVVAGLALDAMFEETVGVIGDTLKNGSEKGKLQAARLHLEVTKRIGSGGGMLGEVIDSNTRLTKLAERLSGLVQDIRGQTINARRNINGQFEVPSSDSPEEG